jgi:hypothetical protein
MNTKKPICDYFTGPIKRKIGTKKISVGHHTVCYNRQRPIQKSNLLKIQKDKKNKTQATIAFNAIIVVTFINLDQC